MRGLSSKFVKEVSERDSTGVIHVEQVNGRHFLLSLFPSHVASCHLSLPLSHLLPHVFLALFPSSSLTPFSFFGSFVLPFLHPLHPTVSQSVSLLVCLSVCLSVCLAICPSVCPSVYPSILLSICLSIHLSVPFSVCLSICPSVSVHSFICLSVSPSIYLSLCPPFY